MMSATPDGMKSSVSIRSPRKLCAMAAVLGVFVGGASVGVADELVVDGVNHAGVRITGLADAYLVFRTAGGEKRAARIDTVELIAVDRGSAFVDFNQAERLVAGGEPAKAVPRYRRMVHTSESFWSDLLAARLLRATDRAGQIDRATGFFIRTAEGRFSGPASAVHLMPTAIPDKRGVKVTRAIEQLSRIIFKLPAGPMRSLLTVFRYDLLRRINDKRAVDEATRVASLTIDESIGTVRVYEIVLAALKSALPRDASKANLAGLDGAIRYCPESALADFLLVKGETLLSRASTRESLIRASWPFMRVVTHMPDDPRAVDGLLGAASALERLGAFDKATDLLAECLARSQISGAARRQAEEALARVSAKRE